MSHLSNLDFDIDEKPVTTKKKSSDFMNMITDAASKIQVKLFSFIFVIFLIISSDVFVTKILGNIRGAVDYKYPTNWGVIIQGLFLVVAAMIMDFVIRVGMI